MCTSCDCKCQKTFSLDIGKTYVTRLGGHVKIVGIVESNYIGRLVKPLPGKANTLGMLFEFTRKGVSLRTYGENYCTDLVKEYKEPVVHKRDIVWYRYHGEMHSVVLKAGGKFPFSNTHELHRQTVEYTEER